MIIFYRPLCLIGFIHVASGLVTLRSIQEITNLTKDCTTDIVHATPDPATPAGLGGQLLFSGGEVQDIVTAAVRIVDNEILRILNVPLDTEVESLTPKPSCTTVVTDYHAFLSATTLLLRAIEDQQQINRWRGKCPVFQAVAWLQSLWASRKANEQQRSFIEQQMTLYSSTGCFQGSNDVLRRNVELVEYMNDLLDTFRM